MEFTNKTIKRLIAIEELIEMTNYLARQYNYYDNEELSRESLKDKETVYKLYCSSLYNAVQAIKNSEYIFCKEKDLYTYFKNIINNEYVADDQKYFKKIGKTASLYKILSEIRHKYNHFEKEDNDEIVLFQVNIDFNKLDTLRILINKLFYNVYNEIDINSIKKIILSQPKIRYSLDKMDEQLEKYDIEIKKINKIVDESIVKSNNEAYEILKDVLSPSSIYDILYGDEDSIRKFEEFDRRSTEMFAEYEKKIEVSGSKTDKKVFDMVKEFCINNEHSSLKEYDKNIKKFSEDVKDVVINSGKSSDKDI